MLKLKTLYKESIKTFFKITKISISISSLLPLGHKMILKKYYLFTFCKKIKQKKKLPAIVNKYMLKHLTI